jgi:hypothetical protein
MTAESASLKCVAPTLGCDLPTLFLPTRQVTPVVGSITVSPPQDTKEVSRSRTFTASILSIPALAGWLLAATPEAD